MIYRTVYNEFMNNSTTTKETIYQCALELFSKKGYEAVSVQELVTMAGITKPTLYYYFGSKEGVYDQLLLMYYRQLDTALNQVCHYQPNPESYHEDIYPVLFQTTLMYFTFSKNNPLFYQLVLSHLHMPKDSSVYDVMENYHFEQYRMLLELFHSMSSIHPNLTTKERRLTWSFLGTVNTYIALYLETEPDSLSDILAKELVHQFMHGIYA